MYTSTSKREIRVPSPTCTSVFSQTKCRSNIIITSLPYRSAYSKNSSTKEGWYRAVMKSKPYVTVQREIYTWSYVVTTSLSGIIAGKTKYLCVNSYTNWGTLRVLLFFFCDDQFSRRSFLDRYFMTDLFQQGRRLKVLLTMHLYKTSSIWSW